MNSFDYRNEDQDGTYEYADRNPWYKAAIVLLILAGALLLFYLFFSKETNGITSKLVDPMEETTLLVNKSVDL